MVTQMAAPRQETDDTPAAPRWRRKLSLRAVTWLSVTALTLGFLTLAALRHSASYYRTVAEDRRASRQIAETGLLRAQDRVNAQLEALSALYLASNAVDADELLAFSRIAIGPDRKSMTGVEFGWMPYSPEEPVLWISYDDALHVREAQVLNTEFLSMLEAVRADDGRETAVAVGGIQDSVELTEGRVTYMTELRRPGRVSGLLFVTVAAETIIANIDLPDGIVPIAMRQNIAGTSIPLFSNPPAAGLPDAETFVIPVDRGVVEVDVQYRDMDLGTFLLRHELKTLLLELVFFAMVLGTVLVSFRQIRLGQLAARQSRTAAREAEESNYQKSRFLATMSHEMRTPLNGIIGMADLIKDGGLDPVSRKYLKTLTSSAEGLLALINQLLDFSKIEAKEIELEETECDLGELVTDTVNAANILAAEKGLELILTLPIQASIPVIIDGFRLRQVLTNLLSNAIKFTESGSVRVIVAMVGKPSDSRATFRFTVRDTGIGIPPDRLGRIFQPFQQADRSTTRKFGGTGLGLTITRDILQVMGSDISVRSEVGEGTEFTFELTVGGDIFARPLRRKACFLGMHRILIYGPDGPFLDSVETAVATAGATVEAVSDRESAEQVLSSSAGSDDPVNMVLALTAREAQDVQDYRAASDNTAGELKIGLLRSSLQSGQPVTAEERACSDFILEFPHTSTSIVTQTYHELNRRPVKTEHAPDRAQASQVDFTGVHVLLVDDDSTNQMYGVALLEQLGCRVSQAWNGQEAIDAMDRDRSIDLMLLDCQMPVMDGLKAAGILKAGMKDGSLKRTPIVALTANASASDREACRQAGMDDFLAKPVRKGDLLPVMEKWLGAASGSPGRGKVVSIPPGQDRQGAEAGDSDVGSVAEPGREEAQGGDTPRNHAGGLADAAREAPPRFVSSTRARRAAASADRPAEPAKPAIKNLDSLPPPAAQPPAPAPAAPQPEETVEAPGYDGAVLDLTLLRETRDTLGDGFQRLLQTFVSSAPQTLTQLQDSLEAKDYDTAQRTAHSLKSSSKMVGAMAMSNAAKALEAECKQTAPSSKRVAIQSALVSSACRDFLIELRNLPQQSRKSA